MDKILRIDVGAEGGPRVTIVPIGDYAGLGGRALTSAIVSKEVPAASHPLGEENKLVISPGLLSGSRVHVRSNFSLSKKSAYRWYQRGKSGGQPSQVLARLGYAAIVLKVARGKK